VICLLDTNIDFQKLKDVHLGYLSCYLTKRLTAAECINPCMGYCSGFPNRQDGSKSLNFNHLVNFVFSNNRLEKILIGTPSELLKLHNELIQLVDNIYGIGEFDRYLNLSKKARVIEGELNKFFRDISAVFNYSWFIGLEPHEDYNAYRLTELLKVRACTYCNRAYTLTRTTSTNGKLMRPQLDHWYPKSKFPLLAISLQNLIPSCYHCNGSVKSDTILDLNIHYHPYVRDGINDDLTYDYFHYGALDKYRVFIKKSYLASGKLFKTYKELRIDEMYNAHVDELKDLIKIKQAYSSSYIDKIQDLFKDTQLTNEEVYRLLFGTELDEKNFHKRPMSKFKHDILKELGIIKKDI